jgi:hypothetical protein
MLLHNVIPHTHESELNNNQHTQIHQTENPSPIDVIALFFHEFTEEGEMEDILVKAKTNVSFNVDFVALVIVNKLFTVVLTEKKESKQHILPLDELFQASGFSTAWSVRPPPFA